MDYVIGAIIALFVIFKIVMAFGRKNAIDVLEANYGLNRKKLEQLKNMAHYEIDSFT